jgi:hypothetical protein
VVTGATSFSQPADFNSAAWMNLDFAGVDISNGDTLRPAVAPPDQAINLAFSIPIDGSGTFAAGASASSNHIGSGPGKFVIGTPGYVGFAMNPGGGPDHFGWMQVILNNSPSGGTIVDYAYESTPGVAILAGAVPEPAAAASFAFGLACFLLRRRR